MTGWLVIGVLLLASPPVTAQPLSSPDEWSMQVVDDQPLVADAGLDALIAQVDARNERGDWPAPDLPAIAAAPAAFRGQIFHLITGPATRVATRAFDIPHLSAWQTTSDLIPEPILLLVYEPRGSAAPGDRVDSIALDAAFWKTAFASMQPQPDQSLFTTAEPAPPRPAQRIVIFVGALPTYASPPSVHAIAWGNIIAALLVGGALLFIFRRLASRRAAARPHLIRGEARGETWNDANLPTEPDEALAELRRRSGDTITHDR